MSITFASMINDETLFSVVSTKRAMNGYESRLDDTGDLLAKFRFMNRYSICLSTHLHCRNGRPVQLTVFDGVKKEEAMVGAFKNILEGQTAFASTITGLLQEEKAESSNHSARFSLFYTTSEVES